MRLVDWRRAIGPLQSSLQLARATCTRGLVRSRLLVGGKRVLPHFVIIGAQKAGTTSLFKYLASHPDVMPPLVKETHFFDYDYHRGAHWYSGFFPTAAEMSSNKRLGRSVITGEATPYYLFHPQVPARLRQVVPWAKLIILLRNPIDRAYSQYLHSYQKGYESRSFEDAVATELAMMASGRRCSDAAPYNSPDAQRAYIRRGQYMEQIERWSRWFPRDQMLILRSEDLFSAPQEAYPRVLAFLELSDGALPSFHVYNASHYNNNMRDDTRKWLEEHYWPHNVSLAEWTGVTW